MRLLPAVLGLTLGCASFPVSLYVDGAALEELRRCGYPEDFDESLLRARAEARTGLVLEILPPTATELHRVDTDPPLAVRPRSAARRDDPATADLRPGDLLLVKNPKAQSLGTKLSSSSFAFHDHLGLLVARGQRWEVVESAPEFRPFGCYEDFAARFQGRVRRVSLASYLRRYEVLTVVRLDDPALARDLARDALAILDEDIRFDPYHDPERPELSCTELLQELLARRGRPWWPAPVPVTANPSMLRVMHAVGFRLPAYVLPDLVTTRPDARIVARFSRHPTRLEARAYELAYRILWEHHQPAAPAGDLIAPDGLRFVRLRARTVLFLGLARAAARALSVADDRELRETLESLHGVVFPSDLSPVADPGPRAGRRPRGRAGRGPERPGCGRRCSRRPSRSCGGTGRP